MRHYLSLSIVIVIFCIEIAPADEVQPLHKALESITQNELREHVEKLADDAFEGREAGSRGGRAAAMYVVNALQAMTLEGGVGTQQFFQSFNRGYRNILAVLPGSDPSVQHEVVVLGAHYDHIGFGESSSRSQSIGYIHNGADDNASGTAALLEIAEAFSSLPTSPPRTIMFAFWDGEEKGMLGSKYWIQHPTVPLEQIVLDINLDMIGRLTSNGVEVVGSRSSFGLRKWVCHHNGVTDLTMYFPWEVDDNSDHWPFFERGIPTLMFHTGLHDDYHRPSDDAHRLNVPGMYKLTEIVFRCAWDVAHQPQRYAYRNQAQNEQFEHQKKFERVLDPPTPRLGVRWSRELHDAPGLLLTEVAFRTPAQQAGLRVGDRLLTINGQEIEDDASFRAEILAAKEPVTIRVQFHDETTPRELKIELAGTPMRLGISWRATDAEPETVTLVRVVSGLPAAEAGLEVHDRVCAIAQQRFKNDEEFRNLVDSISLPFEVLVERNGRLHAMTLQPILAASAPD